VFLPLFETLLLTAVWAVVVLLTVVRYHLIR
jgi:hypothetical protein